MARTIHDCPRCHRSHTADYERFAVPVVIGEYTFDRWFMCHIRHEPVLVQYAPQPDDAAPDRKSKAAGE